MDLQPVFCLTGFLPVVLVCFVFSPFCSVARGPGGIFNTRQQNPVNDRVAPHFAYSVFWLRFV